MMKWFKIGTAVSLGFMFTQAMVGLVLIILESIIGVL